jgi:DNA-binding GntR family transcriptional regulator
MKFEPLESKESGTQYLVDSAYNAIRDAILGNQLKPGTNLSEAELARKLGISRTPTREALKRLEEDGLVQNIPRKGAFVTEITIEMIVEIYQLREALECYAVEFVPHYGDPDELERLEKEIINTPIYIKDNRIDLLHRLDERMHAMIVCSAQNQMLIKLNQRFIQQGSLNRHVIPMSIERLMEIHREQLSILESIRARNILTAREAVANHLRNSCNHVVQVRLKML